MRRSEFFERVPDLFQRANRKAWETYEETLFLMRRPVTHGNYHCVKRLVGGESAPHQALRDPRVFADLDRILSRARYPKAGQLTRLEDFSDGSTELATSLLHFNNPAFPVYDAASVAGLNQLGIPLQFVSDFGENTHSAYQAYIDIVQEFKEEISYRFVPEKNYYLTRIVQLSLHELGLEALPRSRAPKAKSAAQKPSAEKA